MKLIERMMQVRRDVERQVGHRWPLRDYAFIIAADLEKQLCEELDAVCTITGPGMPGPRGIHDGRTLPLAHIEDYPVWVRDDCPPGNIRFQRKLDPDRWQWAREKVDNPPWQREYLGQFDSAVLKTSVIEGTVRGLVLQFAARRGIERDLKIRFRVTYDDGLEVMMCVPRDGEWHHARVTLDMDLFRHPWEQARPIVEREVEHAVDLMTPIAVDPAQ